MPRLVNVRKKQRQIILSAADRKELCEKFNASMPTVHRALHFIYHSLIAHEIRNSALNDFNGILIER